MGKYIYLNAVYNTILFTLSIVILNFLLFVFHYYLIRLCCGNLVALIYFRISMQAWQHPRGPLHDQILLRKPQKRRLDKLPGCEG